MTTDKLGGAVRRRVRPRGDRLVCKVSTQVVGKLRDRLIAFRRVVLQRLRDDRVEVAAEELTQPLGGRGALRRTRRRVAAGPVVNGRPQVQRLGFRDRFRKFRGRSAVRTGWMLAGQKLEQE